MTSWLNDEHLHIQTMVREFAEKEVEGLAAGFDLEDKQIPESLLQQMGDLGFFGLCLPTEYGGGGMDMTSLCIVTEELARRSLAVGSVIHRNSICGHILAKAGTSDQKERWLPAIASGKIQTASAATEPEAGSDAANIQTRAQRQDDVYLINGSKQWTTFADRANMLFTYVRTSNESKHDGISLLLVEKQPGPEFVPPHLTGSRIATAGYHGMNTYSLEFNDFATPVGNLVGGQEGKAFRQLMTGYESARITFAFRCIGLARAAYEAALAYSKDRVQFGKPISEFQAIRFKLADMATQIEAARALGYTAARQFDDGKRVDLQAGMAKLFAADMAHRVCWDALYIHGGNGYAVDAPVNRYWRDSGLLPIGERN